MFGAATGTSGSAEVGADEDALAPVGADAAWEAEHDPQVETLVRLAYLEAASLVESDQLRPVTVAVALVVLLLVLIIG